MWDVPIFHGGAAALMWDVPHLSGRCNRGVQLSMRGIGALSTPMTAGDIDQLVNAFDATLGAIRAEGWF